MTGGKLRPWRRSLVPLLPLLAVWVLASWTPASPSPAGCEALFAATSRGGGAPPSPGASSCSLRPPSDTALVQRVVDGDTIVLAGGERVRYIGIDTPEVGAQQEPFVPEATVANRRLVEGKRVLLEQDVSQRDRFGRLLRYVYVDGILVNAELVREGYARAVAYPPDTRYAACLSLLEAEAKEARRGIWVDRASTP